MQSIDLVPLRVGHAEHREMGPKAVDDPELHVRDELLLSLAISRWKNMSRENGTT